MAGFFGFGNYEKAGIGIAKNSSPKSRIKLFFEILGVRIWKLFTLNMIFTLCCIPVITIGPALAGMTKVLKNYSIDKNAFVWSDFKDAFKKNFWKAFVLGIIDIIAYLGIAVGCYLYPQIASETGNKMFYVLFIVTVSVAMTFTIMNFYMYLMLVSTDLSMKNIVKNSLALTFLAPKQNLFSVFIMIAISIGFFCLILLNLQFIFFLPFVPASFIGFIVCFNCYPIIQKYVINPYYESKGEKNPEISDVVSDPEEVLFEDMGGKEKAINPADKLKGDTEGRKTAKKGKRIS